MTYIERFNSAEKLFDQVRDQFEVKNIKAEAGDFGDLRGFQFDSEKLGGFVYFWSSNYVEYHLVDYKLEVEITMLTSKIIESDNDAMLEISLLIASIESHCA
jgi:hypothetical protein